jgi:L-threonylcarbamoyladenylate synthase
MAGRGGTGENRNVKTLQLKVDLLPSNSPEAHAALDRAAAILRDGGLVALPTETVYGLGANALDAKAVERIFRAKQRPSWDPVIVHISSLDMLDGLVQQVPDVARRLMDAFWPGPLTLLLPRTSAVPDAVTSGRPLVGVRMPAHPVALELIRRAGVPVAAPSANTFGHTSPTTAAHVLQDLDGRIDAVLDAGPTEHGVESTVLDPCQTPMIIYRPGAVTADQIRAIGGAVETYSTAGPLREATPESSPQGSPAASRIADALPSPGVGLRHYAPRARLMLIEAPFGDLPARIGQLAQSLAAERLGVMLPAELPAPIEAAAIFPWGSWAVPEEMARDLYAGLRALDVADCTVILCPVPPDSGIGAAIRDRLCKAACSD